MAERRRPAAPKRKGRKVQHQLSGKLPGSDWVLACGSLLLLVGGVYGWLAVSGADTRQDRADRTPSVEMLVRAHAETPACPDGQTRNDTGACVTPEPAPCAVGEVRNADGACVAEQRRPPQTVTTDPAIADPAITDSGTTDPGATDPPATGAGGTDTGGTDTAGTGTGAETAVNGTGTLPPPPAAPQARIALIITELGLSERATLAAIRDFPPEVTLAFLPTRRTIGPQGRLTAQMLQAVDDGHEVLLQVPMEPDAFPADDPGDLALLTNLPAGENQRRLSLLADRTDGYVGLASFQGSRYVRQIDSMRGVLGFVAEQGKFFVDLTGVSTSTVPSVARELGLPVGMASLRLDRSPSRPALRQAFSQAEQLALQNGIAVAVAGTYPSTFLELADWLPSLAARGIELVPVSRAVTLPGTAADPLPQSPTTEQPTTPQATPQ